MQDVLFGSTPAEREGKEAGMGRGRKRAEMEAQQEPPSTLESSRTGVAFQSCPERRQGVQAFIAPHRSITGCKLFS